MKRNYVTPVIVMEAFNVTQGIPGCITKINYMNSQCVLDDSDAVSMWDWAGAGWFVAGNCDEAAESKQFDDGICYHTSVQKAFTS